MHAYVCVGVSVGRGLADRFLVPTLPLSSFSFAFANSPPGFRFRIGFVLVDGGQKRRRRRTERQTDRGREIFAQLALLFRLLSFV